MAKDLPTIEELRKLLSYDPDTGVLTWRRRDDVREWWNARYAGTPALACLHDDGYLKGRINYRLFRAHRVAWALHYGRWPQDEIDHVNGVRSDNRIENLRDVSKTENMRNMKRSPRNTSGTTGVGWCKTTGKWAAVIHLRGKRIRLGRFANKIDAVSARKDAEKRYGFHLNHGR